jgi:hypothetical protein
MRRLRTATSGGDFWESMTDHQRKNLWSALAFAAIIALLTLVVVQQSWVKRRPIGIAPRGAQSRLCVFFPSKQLVCQLRPAGENQEAASGVKAA